MRGKSPRRTEYLCGALLLAAVTLLALLARPSRAQLSAEYDLAWWSVDGGGEGFVGGGMRSATGSLSLTGTAGQADAGFHEGGTYVLAGGFQPGGEVSRPETRLYLPLLMSNH